MTTEPDPIDVEIGALLRRNRENAGLSQGAVARLLGWHRPTITIIESGARGIHVRDLRAYARALGVPVVRLLPVGWRK